MFIALNDINSHETILRRAEDLIGVHFYPKDLIIVSSFINRQRNSSEETIDFTYQAEDTKDYLRTTKRIRKILNVKEICD